MIINTTTKEFSKLDARGRKKVFEKFFGHKVNQIVSGGLINGTYGNFEVRHETYAYSKLRIDTTEDGYMQIVIWNFEKEKWQEEVE